jgi:hypothetical protein
MNISLQFRIVPMPLMEYFLFTIESFSLPRFHRLMITFKLIKVDILRSLVQRLIMDIVSVPLVIK